MLETSDQDNFDAARSEISSVEKFVSLAIQNAPTPEQKEEDETGMLGAAYGGFACAGLESSSQRLSSSLQLPAAE